MGGPATAGLARGTWTAESPSLRALFRCACDFSTREFCNPRASYASSLSGRLTQFGFGIDFHSCSRPKYLQLGVAEIAGTDSEAAGGSCTDGGGKFRSGGPKTTACAGITVPISSGGPKTTACAGITVPISC